MSEFQIIDEKRYPLDVESSFLQRNISNLPYHRWEHRVTIGYNGERFMVFIDNGDISQNIFSSMYIEKITPSELEFIEDESLFESLLHFAKSKGFVNMLPPIQKRTLQ